MFRHIVMRGLWPTKGVLATIAVLYSVAVLLALSACAPVAAQPATCSVQEWDNGAAPISMGFRMQELPKAAAQALIAEYNKTPPQTDTKAERVFMLAHPANRSTVHFALVSGKCLEGVIETDVGFASQLLAGRGA